MGKKQKAPPMVATQKEYAVPIKWNVPETIVTRFASNLVVQHIEGYFKLSFFEIKPDIITDPNDVKPPTEIVAECVGSIIIPPHKLQSIIDVLSRQLEQRKTPASSQAE